MLITENETTQNQKREPGRHIAKRRLRVAVASLAAALILGACGGGGNAAPYGNFNIGVTVGGLFMGDTSVAPGGSTDLAIHVGQSVRLDAGEPVVWTLYVGGSAISGGVQMYYAGADFTATTLSSSTVVLDTYAAYQLQSSIPMTLVATSTYDSFQVATVNLWITN